MITTEKEEVHSAFHVLSRPRIIITFELLARGRTYKSYLQFGIPLHGYWNHHVVCKRKSENINWWAEATDMLGTI